MAADKACDSLHMPPVSLIILELRSKYFDTRVLALNKLSRDF